MGLFTSEMFKQENSEVFHHPPEVCFMCGDPMPGKAWIFWNGIGAQIWMHPKCAKSLADHLNKDFEKYLKERNDD